MPVFGYKKKFKNLKSLEKDLFIVKFKVNYRCDGGLEVDGNSFDVGSYNLMLDKVFDEFNEEKFLEYDNGIYILSVCKYIVDRVPLLYSIVYEEEMMVDTYYKDEIIRDYDEYNNRKN